MMANSEKVARFKEAIARYPEKDRAVFKEKYAAASPEKQREIFERLTGGATKKSGLDVAKDVVTGAVVEPAMEIARGFQMQGADMFGNMDLADPTGAAGAIASSSAQSAEAIPQTNMVPAAKQVYQSVGRLPGQVAEAMMIGKVVNAARVPAAIKAAFGDIKAAGQMSEAVTLGVQSAINEFRNTQSFSEASNAFKSGAAAGLGVAAFAEVAPRAIEIGKMMGKAASKAFLKGVTGDERFAEAFVNNPNAFNLNPFSKVRSFRDVEVENTAKINAVQSEFNEKMMDAKAKAAERKSALASELDKDYFTLKEKHKMAQKALSDKSKLDAERVYGESKAAFESAVDKVNVGLLDDFNGALTKVEETKFLYGKKVQVAVENITNKDPLSRVSMPKYLARFKEVAEENGAKLVSGKVMPKAGPGTGDPAVLELLQQNLNDIKQIADVSGIPLGFVQAKKELWQKSGYAGREAVHTVQRQLSGALNPVNLADDIVGRGIEKEIGALKAANSEYHTLVPKYEEAIKNFTKTDATGKPVADFQKVLNAVRKNDRATLKQIAKADSLLPSEDRLLPKAQEAAKKISQAETLHKATLKVAQRKASEKMFELKEAIRQKEFQIRQANKAKRFTEAQRLQSSLNTMKTVEKTKLENTLSKLNGETEFFRQQDIARSYTPPSQTRRAIQAGGVISTATNIASNPGLAALTGLGSIALSPKVAAATVKQGGKMANASGEALMALSQLVNTRIGKVMSARALSDLGAQEE